MFTILCLADLFPEVEKKIMHFHYMTYMATPNTRTPAPGGHEIYNLGRPFLGHHYYILCLSEPCPGVEKNMRNVSILPPNYLPLRRGGGGVMKSPYPTEAAYQIGLRLAQWFLRRC